jgi:soluble lytic murein transglycosylase
LGGDAEKMSNKAKIRMLIIFFIILALILICIVGYVVLKKKFPLRYEDLIVRYAAEYDLAPSLVATVIWAESGYRPEVTSHRGAVGLMQIMPETGEWIAGKLGVSDYKEEQLKDPNTNIMFGCWYLSFLKERFLEDEVKILAAYNAGQDRVAEWEETWGEGHLPDADDIPFEETKKYVGKIQKAKKLYQVLYKLR